MENSLFLCGLQRDKLFFRFISTGVRQDVFLFQIPFAGLLCFIHNISVKTEGER